MDKKILTIFAQGDQNGRFDAKSVKGVKSKKGAKGRRIVIRFQLRMKKRGDTIYLSGISNRGK